MKSLFKEILRFGILSHVQCHCRLVQFLYFLRLYYVTGPISFEIMFVLTKAFILMYQASIASDYNASVNRVIWSPDGNSFGMVVPYTKKLYSLCYNYD